MKILRKVYDGITWWIYWLFDMAVDGIKLMATFAMLITLFVATVAIDAYVLSVLWDYVIPSLFPKAVELGYIAKTMPFSVMFWACVGLFIVRPANLNDMISITKGDKQ